MDKILRNIFAVFRHYKTAILLNILGLSLAFATFYILIRQVHYEWTFDHCYPEYEKIFRVEGHPGFMEEGDDRVWPIVARPMADLFVSCSPHIESAGMKKTPDRSFIYSENEEESYEMSFFYVMWDFAEVFGFQMIEGNAYSIKDAEKVLIPESLAKKLFGEEPAVGRTIRKNSSDIITIGGVYKEFPANSNIENEVYQMLGKDYDVGKWYNRNYFLYVKLDDPRNAEKVAEQITKVFSTTDRSKDQPETFSLAPVTSLYYKDRVFIDDYKQKGNRWYTYALLSIAILIIIISVINFNNFSMALAPVRLKNIGLQQLYGQKLFFTRAILVLETLITGIVAMFISVILVVLISSGSWLDNLFIADIKLTTTPADVVLICIVVCLLCGLAAGLWSSRYITSFSLIDSVKGKNVYSPAGKRIRNILIMFQFLISLILITVSLGIHSQNRYMQNRPLGFNDEHILSVRPESNTYDFKGNKDALVNTLKSCNEVEDVAFSWQTFLYNDKGYDGWGRSWKDQAINFHPLIVSPNFTDVMGISLYEGRNFRKVDADVIMFNRTAQAKYGLETGDIVDNKYEIIGFFEDIVFMSSREDIKPMAIFPSNDRSSNQMLVRLNPGVNLKRSIASIEAVIKEHISTPMDIRLLHEAADNLYKKELNLSNLISVFGFIAIFISMTGVFGLVIFETQTRRREIGIRKVHGSRTSQILYQFNKTYIKIVLICAVFSTPIAWIIVDKWLEAFVYRMSFYYWIFIAALILVLLIVSLTVTLQSWRAANENPVNSITSE